MRRKQQRIAHKEATQHHARARRSLALQVFREVDELVERELARSAAHGQPSSCAPGCAHCCRQELYAPRAEVEAIVDWIETTAPQLLDELRPRIAAWLAWYRTEYPALVAAGAARRDAFHGHAPPCPALVDDRCTIYPVRPTFCRSHHVTSPPDACRPVGDPARLDAPVASMRLFARVAPIGTKLRALVESQGADFNGTVHLLVEWLAHLLGVESQPWRTAAPLRAAPPR